MPVSTGSLGEPRAKRCKLCDESNHRSESGSGYWQLQLDRDLIDTISAIYPEWFKNNMAEGGSPSPTPRESPPKAVIDTSPIVMDQNKESLKVKLLLRQPFDKLVAQGIMPPHKTPAAFHGQRRQLERAKTGDMLKAKIQQRPPRQELERRHILEADPGHVDPSIAERQRMLKKARLADQLNDQLSHRPGPLELIQKNILHTEEPIEQAVKTGRIPYKATSEGQLNRPQHPQSYVNPEDDSQSSEGDNVVCSPGPSDVLETAAKSAGIVVSLIQPTDGAVVVTTSASVLNKDNNNGSEIVFANLCNTAAAAAAAVPLLSSSQQGGGGAGSASSPASLLSSTSTLSPLSSVASPVPSVVSSQPATPVPVPPPPPPPISLVPRVIQSSSQLKSDAPGKDKNNRKKSKSKSTPKTRTIKFHEYKGPPSAQKNNNNNANSGESSYDLLLQQQTLLLQFQLQLQHKYPQIILPASQKTQNENSNNSNNNHINSQQLSPAPSTSSESSAPATTRITGRLEDMKVSDLKAELKRRSLPVSGSKPQLIERLKPYTNQTDVIIASQNTSSVDSNSLDQSHNSPTTTTTTTTCQDNNNIDSPTNNVLVKEEPPERMDISDPLSPLPQQQQTIDPFQQQQQQDSQKSKEDIVREQERQIEVLKREISLYQKKLQAATRTEPKAQLIALQKHLQIKQQQQQQQQQQQNLALQMKQLQQLQARQSNINEEQQRIQQQQHVAFQNQKNITGGLVINAANAAIVFNHLIQGKTKVINGHNRSSSLPNFVNTIVAPVITNQSDIKNEDSNVKLEFKDDDLNHFDDHKPPPPLYEEATKQINNIKKNNVKSQIVDDVLEILIKNGELPPSAANDPTTPGSAGVKNAEPVYPSLINQQIQNHIVDPNCPEEAALGIDPSELLDSLDGLENMDFNQFVMDLGGCQNDNNNIITNDQDTIIPMDTDDWLESLLPTDSTSFNANNGAYTTTPLTQAQEVDLSSCDPLLGINQDTFDPFNLDEFRSPADLTTSLSWDKIDFAA